MGFYSLTIMAFAQKTMPTQNAVEVATDKDLNMLIRLAPYIDYALLFAVSYKVFTYFVDFKTERAFINMIPIALSIFIAFHWRMILGWVGVFGV